MANNSIGAYAQGGSNDIGAYEYAAPAGGGRRSNVLSGPLGGPLAGPICSLVLAALLFQQNFTAGPLG